MKVNAALALVESKTEILDLLKDVAESLVRLVAKYAVKLANSFPFIERLVNAFLDTANKTLLLLAGGGDGKNT